MFKRSIGMCGFSLMAAVLLTGSPALAGFVVHKEVRTRDDMSNRTEVSSRVDYFDTDNGRFNSDNAIMRFDTGEMILFNPGQKTYYRNTIDGYCRDIKKVVTEITSTPQYQKMKKAAEEMKKQLKEQYGDRPMPKPPQMSLHKLGAVRIAGYRAEHYEVKRGSQVDRQVWLAVDPRLDALDPAKNPRLKKKALAFEKKFKSCAAKLNEVGPGTAADTQESVDPLEDETRFELRSKDTFSEEITTSIERKAIPPSRFEPPAGYRKLSLKKFMMATETGREADLGSSDLSGMPTTMSEENPVRAEEPAPAPPTSSRKGLLQKDAEDVGQSAVQNAHDQTKRAIEDKIGTSVKKGLMKLFGN